MMWVTHYDRQMYEEGQKAAYRGEPFDDRKNIEWIGGYCHAKEDIRAEAAEWAEGAP